MADAAIDGGGCGDQRLSKHLAAEHRWIDLRGSGRGKCSPRSLQIEQVEDLAIASWLWNHGAPLEGKPFARKRTNDDDSWNLFAVFAIRHKKSPFPDPCATTRGVRRNPMANPL